jgi:hypothetical protein
MLVELQIQALQWEVHLDMVFSDHSLMLVLSGQQSVQAQIFVFILT